jgi:hypothetical protein
VQPIDPASGEDVMNRLTAAVEAELALIRRAIHDATHNRVTAKIAAISGVFARIFKHGARVSPATTAERRHRGAYAWDARGNFVPLQKGGATHSGNYDVIAPAPGTRGSETSKQHRND